MAEQQNNVLFQNVCQIIEHGEPANTQTILHALSAKSENILNSLRSQSPIHLSWTNYRIILKEKNKEAREWYEQEATREMWSTRTLQPSTLHICQRKKNCVARLSNRRNFSFCNIRRTDFGRVERI